MIWGAPVNNPCTLGDLNNPQGGPPEVVWFSRFPRFSRFCLQYSVYTPSPLEVRLSDRQVMGTASGDMLHLVAVLTIP